MPSYAKVLTETYLPAQAAKLRWESAKAVAGAQFDDLAEQQKAVAEVRLRRQQYAENIRTRASGTDAFMFQAVQGLVGVQTPTKDEGGPSKAYKAALADIRALPTGTAFKTNDANYNLVQNALKESGSIEQAEQVERLARSRGWDAKFVIPGNLESERVVKKKAQEGDAAAQAKYMKMVGTNQALVDLADNLGDRAFQGGTKAREFFENLTDDQQELSRIYAAALLDDGVVSPDEIPEGRLGEAEKLYKQIQSKGAYRLQDKGAYDAYNLGLLKDLAAKEGELKTAEARLQGKTKETLAEELYTGATERASIPPLLRSLEPEMKKYLDGYSAALTSDPKTDPEAYLKGQLTDREAKGFAAASAMAASGMRAADIMNSLGALSPEERRSVMGALASRDAIASTQMRVAPGTPLPEIEKIQTEDRRAQEAELARTESRLQKRLRQLDESLASSRQSGFGDIVSRDQGLPRREILMAGLQPSAADLDREEVDRIAKEREAARIERDRLEDTGLGDYDPSLRLPEPPAPKPLPLTETQQANLAEVEDMKVARLQEEADKKQALQELALQNYRQLEDPRDAAATRAALMQGLESARPVGPTREDLRPEPLLSPGSTRKINLDEPEPAPAAPAAQPELSEADRIRAMLRSGTYPKGSPAFDAMLDRLDVLEGM